MLVMLAICCVCTISEEEEANRGVDFILLLKHDAQEIGIKDAMPKAKVTASTAWYWLSGDTSEGRVTKCRVCGM